MKQSVAWGLVLLASMFFALPATAQIITNGTFTGPSGWIFGGSGCVPAVYDATFGSPAGSAKLNACGELTSDPTVAQPVTGFIVGGSYALMVDVHLHVNASGANGQSFGVFAGSALLFSGEFLDTSWHTLTLPFTATTTTVLFTFAGERKGSDVSYYVDNVSLVAIPSLTSVYVNDNTSTNTVTGFSATASTLTFATNNATTGKGLPGVLAANQQAVASYPGVNCLFASDPNSSPGFTKGNVASFIINSNGTLTFAGRSADPTNTHGANKGIPLAVDRRPGFPYLYAAFTGENKIVAFKVNIPGCRLTYLSSTSAVGVGGFPVGSMAVSRAGAQVLVVTYQGGSIQSFLVSAGTVTSTGPAVNSTGFTTQGGVPSGVDITANGLFAVFGDKNSSVTEVEVASISGTGVLGTTVDYGGLSTGINSQNVWISPSLVSGQNYLYISNNDSKQVTTAKLSTGGVVSAIPASSCPSGFFNPSTLNSSTGFTFSGGIQTQGTSGTGGYIYVAEQGSAPLSSIAVLKVDTATGCTQEALGSPYTDTFSNALTTLSVFPNRPF